MKVSNVEVCKFIFRAFSSLLNHVLPALNYLLQICFIALLLTLQLSWQEI
jgi:hypothetical protein